MKICILSLPRTSSSAMFETLSLLTGIKNAMSEPFNNSLWTEEQSNNFYDKIIKDDEILTKLMYRGLPHNIEEVEDFLIWIKNNFTHVICLYREDTLLQSESFCYHSSKPRIKWYTPKLIDLSNIDKEYIEKMKIHFYEDSLSLIKFANENNFPLFKYEDLIINEGNNKSFEEICNYLNIDFNYQKIKPYYRKELKVSYKVDSKKLL